MKCKICSKPVTKIFKRRILEKFEVDYFQCSSCGFIQTEEPYWLNDAYINPINIEDTGIVRRNLLFAKRTAGIILIFFNKNGAFVDIGGGTGLFVRIMRDFGFDFFWDDPYTKNIFARGFEYDKGKHKNIELVTAFECFEHFTNPMKEIRKLLSISDSILFSTVPFINGTPDPNTWEYYSFQTGQHISLYSLRSLRFIARKFNLNFYTNKKSFHLLTPKSISNILYNFSLKLSILTIPLLLKPWLRTRLYMDNKIISR